MLPNHTTIFSIPAEDENGRAGTAATVRVDAAGTANASTIMSTDRDAEAVGFGPGETYTPVPFSASRRARTGELLSAAETRRSYESSDGTPLTRGRLGEFRANLGRI